MRGFIVFALILASCAQSYGVRRIDDQLWFKRESSTALDADHVSERTRQFLRREVLLEQHQKDPDGLIRDLDQRLVADKDRLVCIALAELCYLQGEKQPKASREAALHYLASAVYAAAYLFDEHLSPPSNEFDPTFRWACDFYNRGFAKVVAYATANPLPDEKRGQRRTWPLVCGDVVSVPPTTALSWDPREFDEIHVAYEYEVKGLPGSARSYGLGVPCVVVRSPTDLAERTKRERFLPSVRQSYAATIVARFEGSITVRSKPLDMFIEVFDPMNVSHVEYRGKLIPLEADLTVPIAYMLQNTPDPGGFKAMRNVEDYPTGLTMLQPYQPGKIPVIFVHGLMSSPLTWVPLFNDLLADPVLRQRYQFWFFMYPTGNPILYSAAQLRKALRATQETYDPDGKDPAFNQMVLFGHSMGGLLSRTCVHTSGDRLWNRIGNEPLDETDLPDKDKEFLRELMYFERLPFVKRIVFMATPHRGSKLALGFIGWLGAKMVRLPRRFTDLASQMDQVASKEALDNADNDAKSAITGVGNLSPKSPALIEVASWPYPKDLPVHSIMGDKKRAGRTGGTDGIVPYWSSHIDGVESELVVKSGHSVQQQQPAIKEVRRILLEHLGAQEVASLQPPPVEAAALR